MPTAPDAPSEHLTTIGIATIIVLALALGLQPKSAVAATSSASINIAVAVQASCMFATSNLAFGLYAGAQKDATSTVTVTCTNTTRYDVGINGGQHAQSSFDWRMTGPTGAMLSYKIYVDPARTIYWGGNPGSDAVAGTGSGSAQIISAYGRVAANQYVVPGSYTDTVTFTLYF
jgi:spore coat protein U-like protein